MMEVFGHNSSSKRTSNMQICDCIANLHLSSLRDTYGAICDYFNDTIWEKIFEHFVNQHLLDPEDKDAVLRAAGLSTPTPTNEMILRLERKKGIKIHNFLAHLEAALTLAEYTIIITMFSPLHVKNCMVSQAAVYVQLPSFPHPVQQFPSQISYTPGLDGTGPYSSPYQSHQPDSINNLSDPYEPYIHIVTHPLDTAVEVGGELVLKCRAESDEEITYTWQRDGKLLHDSNTKVLMLGDITHNDSGDYVCLVRTQSVQVMSHVARVTVFGSCSPSQLDCNLLNYIFHATEKFALLIANEDYENSPTLASASNDVEALAETLRTKLSFKTVTLVNLKLEEMCRSVKLFCEQLVDGAYCVTYLAGHGFENDGQCYIVPTDAPKIYSSKHCFSIGKMIEDVRTSCNLNLSVFLLDVCRKRNNYSVTLPEPVDRGKKSGNYVISYATVEHGMAYEVTGQRLGVYVASLQKYLANDKRVTRILELVHRDIHNRWNEQQPEFKSNVFEDRKLTDPVLSPLGEVEQDSFVEKWESIHVGAKPTLFVFESCGAKVELYKTCIFSNKLLLEVKLLDSGTSQDCNVAMLIKGLKKPTKKIFVENLQRLTLTDIKVIIVLKFRLDENFFEEHWSDSIPVPFVAWWN